MKFRSAQYDDLLKRLEKSESNYEAVKLENQSLNSELFAVKQDLHLCKNTINNMEQYTRRDCLKLRAFQKSPEKTPRELQLKLAR